MEVSIVDDSSRPGEVVAYHEAGHCVTAYRLRIPFSGRNAVTIVPSEDYSGLFVHKNILRAANLEWDSSDRSRLRMERTVQVCLGGIEAQRRYDASSIRYGEEYGDWDGGYDYHEAVDLIGFFSSGPKEIELYLELLRFRTEQLVNAEFNWKCIEALAKVLLQKKSLSDKEALSVIQAATREMVQPVPSQSLIS